MTFSIQDRLRKQAPFTDLAQTILDYSRQAFTRPDDPSGWANLGVAARCAGKLDTAIACYRRAAALGPDSPVVLSNLGGALRASGELDEAIEHLQTAVELSPGFAAGHFNLGLALEDAGRLSDAIVSYEQALILEPNRNDAAIQKAFTLLAMGRLEEGFRAYEKRLEFEPMLQRGFSQPAWDGRSFANKTLLLYAEQGRGDTFQFIRYAPLAKSLGGRVIVECQPETADLVRGVEGVDEVVLQGQPLPAFDYWASLMSLPFIFKTTLETIPQSNQYLRVPAKSLNSIRLAPTPLYKIGIVWASGHEDVGANERSMSFNNFLKLLELPQVALYSLQVGPAISQLASSGCQHLIQDVGRQFKDFSGTADAIRQLDLIVSIDTAVIHLAAALGKPVWVLLPYASEWRWLQNRPDSPWYSTAKLYRQECPHDWANVIDRVARDLEKLLVPPSSGK